MLHGASNVDSSDVEARAKALYNKLPGVLTFTNTRILWTKDGHSKPTVNIAHSKLTSMFSSKAGVPKKRLRLHVADQPEPYQFSFTSPPAVADAELEKFKSLLAAVVSANTAGFVGLAPSTPRNAPTKLLGGSPTPPLGPSTSSQPSRPSPTPYGRSSSVVPLKGGQYSFDVYQKVLTKNPELADLHHVLVQSGQITEQEFWEGREYLLESEASASAQHKGKSSEIVAPRLKTGENGQILLTLTPQLLADIFEEFPIVLQAYSDNVPHPLSESQFWERYFSSKLFDRHRASSRNSVAKEDPIFDKYLEREDDEAEPLHPKNHRMQLLLDLGANEVDHGETGNERDVTMKAGKKKNAIPIIRRFNEHSERLLQSALGEAPTSHPIGDNPRDFVPEHSGYYEQIDLEDLRIPDSSRGIALNLQNARGFLNGTGDASGKMNDYGDAVNPEVDERMLSIVTSMASSIGGWSKRLEQFNQDRDAGVAALQDMTANVTSRLQNRLRKDEVPPYILQQITTCATATNEFLRQFWTTLHPPNQDAPTLGALNTAQREAKMNKMISYIARTHEKVNAIKLTGQHAGVDLQVMETAFAPLLAAVDRAISVYEIRKK